MMAPRKLKIDKSVLSIGVPARIRDDAHRRFVASLPCCHCGAPPPTQAAHIRSGLAGGVGLKPSDALIVPLSPSCHARQHATSEADFFGDIDQAKTLATALYAISGDGLKGLQLIVAYRRGVLTKNEATNI